MNQTESPQNNMILGALTGDTYKRLLSHLELVQMHCGDVIYESGCEFPYHRGHLRVLSRPGLEAQVAVKVLTN